MMTITIQKPKARKGFSYVLKSSWLQEAIEAHQLTTSLHIVYHSPKNHEQADWTLIVGKYWFPNPRVNYPRFYIEIGAVPVNLKPQAITLVQTEVLPQLLDWMVQQEKLDLESTMLKVDFQAILKDGSLLIS